MIHKKMSENGSTTLEFALLFPISFLVTFFAAVLLFRSADALLINYETNRLCRIQNLEQEISVFYENQVTSLPLFNHFQVIEYSVSSSEAPFVEAEINVSNGLIPSFLLRLTMTQDAINRTNYYGMMRERALYVNDF